MAGGTKSGHTRAVNHLRKCLRILEEGPAAERLKVLQSLRDPLLKARRDSHTEWRKRLVSLGNERLQGRRILLEFITSQTTPSDTRLWAEVREALYDHLLPPQQAPAPALAPADDASPPVALPALAAAEQAAVAGEEELLAQHDGNDLDDVGEETYLAADAESSKVAAPPRKRARTTRQEDEPRQETEPEQEAECPVCLDPLTADTAIVTLDCGHLFCKVCITDWASRKSICPTCRRTLKTAL